MSTKQNDLVIKLSIKTFGIYSLLIKYHFDQFNFMSIIITNKYQQSINIEPKYLTAYTS